MRIRSLSARARGARGPVRPRGRRTGGVAGMLAAALLLALLASGCAYFNTFYHAKRYYKQAEKMREESIRIRGESTGQADRLYKQSADKCQKVIDNYPGSKWQDDAYLLMAKAHYGRGDYLAARKTLETLETRFPESDLRAEARFWQGKTAYAEGEYPSARQIWGDLLEEFPDLDEREEVQYYLAEAEWKDGRHQAAEEAFRKYLAAYPGSDFSTKARLNLGQVYLEEEQYEDAEQVFREVARHGREELDRHEAKMFLGETLEYRDRFDEALELYNDLATDLDPQVYKWRMSAAELEAARQAELAEARAAEAQAALQDTLGQAAADTAVADTPENRRNIVQGLPNNPNDPNANRQRRRDIANPVDQQIAQILLKEGAVTAKLGRPFEAIEVYEQVVIEFPRTAYAAEAQYRIGYTHEVMLEDFDKAAESYAAVNQHGASSFREDAARRAKNLSTVKALLAKSESDSASSAAAAAAEARFMRAELYLFQQDDPEKALTEYRGIENEFAGTEHAAKAGLAVAWVTQHSLGDSLAAIDKYKEIAAAYPQSEYGRRASVAVYGPEKEPEPEEFAGPGVDELRAQENLDAIALLLEKESETGDGTPPAPGPAPGPSGPATPGSGAAPGQQVASLPSGATLSDAVRSTPDAVKPAGTDEIPDLPVETAGTVSRAPAPPVEAAAETASSPVSGPVETAASGAEEFSPGGEPRPGSGAETAAAGTVAAAGADPETAGGPGGGPSVSSPRGDAPARFQGPAPEMAPVEAGNSGPAAGAPVTAPLEPQSLAPAGADPGALPRPGPGAVGNIDPMSPVPSAAGPGPPGPPAGEDLVPGTLMDVPRGLYLDPLAVPEDGPTPVKRGKPRPAAAGSEKASKPGPAGKEAKGVEAKTGEAKAGGTKAGGTKGETKESAKSGKDPEAGKDSKAEPKEGGAGKEEKGSSPSEPAGKERGSETGKDLR